MCQWKFFVFTYTANTSARMAFIVPLISLTAAADRSVRVASGASRLCASSSLFFELGLFILIAPLFRMILNPCIGRGRGSSQSHCRERARVEVTSHAQAVAALIAPERLAHLRAERSIA